ncbi:Delta(6)-protoilludene synthase [Cladobotryum mycophilum]|uniref:Terpene synthase n=1 Tax=Cladobotryum mycophilum TaxID=491253 RepID=A0ABR0T0R9_9HYPO
MIDATVRSIRSSFAVNVLHRLRATILRSQSSEQNHLISKTLTLAIPDTNLPKKITIPDLLAQWPFKRSLHHACAEITTDSAEWIQSFSAFDSRQQKSYEKAATGLLAALTYPSVSQEHAKLAANMLTLFLIAEETTNLLGVQEVREVSAIIMDALRYPEKPRPDGEPILGRITQSLWLQVKSRSNATAMRRFVENFNDFLDGLCSEANDRGRAHTRDLQTYMALRRCTIGSQPCFDFLLILSDLPDTTLNNGLIKELEMLATDMVILSNDICSWNIEQSRADEAHNIVTVAMVEKQIPVQEAINFAAERFKVCASQFTEIMNSNIHGWEKDLQFYVNGLGAWVTGNHEWNFENGRYALGVEARRTGIVEVLPRKLHR